MQNAFNQICVNNGFPFFLNPNRISFRNETTFLTTFDRYNFHTIIKEFSVVVNTKKLKYSSVTKVTPSSLPFRNILVIDDCCARANEISYINVFLKFENLIILFFFCFFKTTFDNVYLIFLKRLT